MRHPVLPAPRTLDASVLDASVLDQSAGAGLASVPLPTDRDLGLAADPCPGRQRGGRDAAVADLASFLAERGRSYRFEMSSPATADRSCSRLSAHLAYGTLSMREVAHATRARMAELDALPRTPERTAWQKSLVSFVGRLHWHCHFMQKLEGAPSIEHRNLHRAYDGLRPDDLTPDGPDADRFAAWAAGRTGFPFVDACMRSLQATGWINFRMRAMLTAVASYQLWLPWRPTGLHLARLFTDYEPGIHWPQIQMQSGTTGINTVRMYNPVKQGYDQDPTGAFVRRWVPELADVPDHAIHEPWRFPDVRGIASEDYPDPIVDHVVAAREARTKVWGVRGGAAYRTAADAIQEAHGSRKSGMPQIGARRRGRSGRKAAGQIEMDV
jgi:deoxyribodipyrimidine photo-lyase